MPGLLALSLLAILFRVPEPSLQVNQPFKAELLISLFLIAAFGVMLGSQAAASRARSNIAMIVSIAVFIAWSAASVFWAASFGSVVHHTLLWSIYLIAFLLFTGYLPSPIASTRFCITTFVIVSLILGFLCIFDYLTVIDFTSSEGDIRIRYGKYAELLVTLSPVLWAAAIYVRQRQRMMLLLIAGLLSWITAMLSLSKGAFLAGIIGFVIFFTGSALFSTTAFRKRVMTFAALWIVITIGTQVFFSWFSAVPSTTSYITGSADQTRTTSAMRVFVWKVGRQMSTDHTLFGVGADNFGLAFNTERIAYRKNFHDVPSEEIAEDYIVERAHNEPLQVLCELGIVGIVLFSIPFVIFAGIFFKLLFRRRRLQPVIWGAIAGITAFLVSSQFSSFSFRSAQNGFVLFMVLAIAVKKMSPSRAPAKAGMFASPAFLLSFAALVLSTSFCISKCIAEYHVYSAERSEFYSDAHDHYQATVAIDPEYAGAYLSHASRAAVTDNDAAARLTRIAIDHGLGVTAVYSQLAKEHAKAGKTAEAEAAYREGLAIFSRSIYLRMEFAVFLEGLGNTDDAAEQAAIARSVDLRQANGWYWIIKEGSVAAFYRSQKDSSIAPPADLRPHNAVRQYIDKLPGT